jgi:cell division protein FtsW (lipid II flippase)
MSKNKSIDTPFLLALCALVTFGLLIFTSAAMGLLARDGGASFTSVAASQLLFGLVCGSILLIFFARLDYQKIRPYTPYFFGFALFLTILTFVPHVGLSLKGASRWIMIGRFSFQPEEILKFATVLFLAAVYSSHFKAIKTLRGGILPLALIPGSAAVLLLLQPNTAGVIIIGLAGVSMLFVGGGRVWHLALLAALGIAVLGAAAMVYPHVRVIKGAHKTGEVPKAQQRCCRCLRFYPRVCQPFYGTETVCHGMKMRMQRTGIFRIGFKTDAHNQLCCLRYIAHERNNLRITHMCGMTVHQQRSGRCLGHDSQ